MTDPNRITALRALEAAMGEGNTRHAVEKLAAIVFDPMTVSCLGTAYTGDPTAAFAAKDALLPGWHAKLTERLRYWAVEFRYFDALRPDVDATGSNPACAMALAIVRVKIWEAENG